MSRLHLIFDRFQCTRLLMLSTCLLSSHENDCKSSLSYRVTSDDCSDRSSWELDAVLWQLYIHRNKWPLIATEDWHRVEFGGDRPMSPEMESMHQFCTPNEGVDARVARSWSVTFAQFVPTALLHFRKKAGRHVPEIGTWIVAENPVCLIIEKRSYKINSVQSDEPAVQEASLSIVVNGILHVRRPHFIRMFILPASTHWCGLFNFE